jgi:hypothetical protein
MFTGLSISCQVLPGWQPFIGLPDKFRLSKNFVKICVNSRPYVRPKCAEKTQNSGKFNESKWSNNGSR